MRSPFSLARPPPALPVRTSPPLANTHIPYRSLHACAQVAGALISGIGYGADPDSYRAHAQAIALITLQSSLALYCLIWAAAGDRIEATMAGVEAAVMGAALLLMYQAGNTDRSERAAQLLEAGLAASPTAVATIAADFNATAGNGTVVPPVFPEAPLARTLREVSLYVGIGAICVPLLLVVYDIAIVPFLAFVDSVKRNERRGNRSGCVAVLFACVLLPLAIGAALLSAIGGMGGSGGKVVSTSVGTVAEVSHRRLTLPLAPNSESLYISAGL